MTEDSEGPKGITTVWARLPRWQHLVLIVLCAAGLVAAIANATVASTSGNRAMHAGFGLVVGIVLVTLVISFRRRPRE